MLKKILKGLIFTGLFIVPFVPFFVNSSLFFPFITTKAFTWRIIVEVIFAAWIVFIIISPEYRPRKSLLLYSLFIFIFIIGLADAFGVAPVKSFWSNFERMEGFVSLLHLGAFFLVVSTFFKEREWKWWWNTSLAASLLMVFYCFFQLSGKAEIHQGGARVDGSLGNAAYLAVYMLFHFFIALYYLLKSKGGMRWVYGSLMVLQAYMIYESATRGAILGTLGGLFLIALLNLKNREIPWLRKASIGVLAGIVFIVGGFFLVRNTSFVKNNSILDRFATISISSIKGEGRAFVWPIALKGIKDRPLLGWGQENFNYVFNKYYDPEMFRFEPWFDRAHNIFLDWGIAGGILGLLGYLSLYVILLIYIWKRDPLITHVEKSVLTGLIAAYFFHNFFVFDHLISYILFTSLLAYVHSQITPQETSPKVTTVDTTKIYIIGVPAVVVTLLVIYFINIKPIIANTSLIKALHSASDGNYGAVVTDFENAYNSSRLGRPEVVEWIATSADSVLSSSPLTIQEKNDYFTFAKQAVETLAKELSEDARYQLIAGSFFSKTGSPELANAYLETARKLTPGKQQVYFELGGVKLNQNDFRGAQEYFKQAYELDKDYNEAKILYLIAAIYTGDTQVSQKLIGEISPNVLVEDSRISSALYVNKKYGDLVILLENRVQYAPSVLQNYVDLAIAYYKNGETSKAVTLLQTVEQKVSDKDTKNQIDSYIQLIKQGKI
ncbi:O-antigen ligase family protein [Candidatus Parcubacteria bacterium]|nr:O-antigen ligase family protein [Candidatus Parcubacteria bacterium]